MLLRRHWAVIFFYTFIACLLTWPLLLRFTTHIPGNGIDDPSLAWNLWWIKHRLVEQLNIDIFHADWMFHPIDINLAFYTLTPLNGLISTPLQFVTSLIVSSNLILLSTYILGGYGTFLLCRWILGNQQAHPKQQHLIWWAALFGGVVYAFASTKPFYAALGQFNIASSHWTPFCILYLLRIHQRKDRRWRWRNVGLCALFLVLQAWSELTYASFLIIFIVIYAGWIQFAHPLSAKRENPAQTHDNPLPTYLPGISRIFPTTVPFVYLALLFIIGISPFLAAMIPDMLREGDFFGSGGGFADVFSADLAGYLLPTRLHPLVGDWVSGLHQSGFSNDVGQHIYLGYVLLSLIVLATVGGKRRNPSPRVLATKQPATANMEKKLVGKWFWVVNLIFFWLLTLGPSPRWFGEPFPFPGPFEFISRLPFFSGNRYPSRYGIMLLICAAVLAAYGLAWLLRQKRLRARAGLVTCAISLLFLAEHLSIPLPLNLSTTPPIYQQIADTPGDFAILELPTGWRNGAYVLGKSDKLIMMQQWYQSIHGKRRLGGNTSRNPWYKFEYFVNAPVVGDLVALMNADQAHFAPIVDEQLDAMIARSQRDAPTVLNYLGVEFVTVRVEKSSPALLRFVDEALPLTLIDEWQGTDWDGEQETIRLYQVVRLENRAQLKGPREQIFDIGGDMGALYLAEGWGALNGENGMRYALRNQVDLMIDLPTVGGTLEIEHIGLPMDVTLNGHALTIRKTTSQPNGQFRGISKSTLTVPFGFASEDVDRLGVRFDGEPAPYFALAEPPTAGGWPIGTTGLFLEPMHAIVALSAGAESGKFARIFVDGESVVSGERGYNMVALTANGTILDTDTFDTIADLSESPRLAGWIDQWPDGTIIAGAASDAVDTVDATMLTETAVNALRSVGVGAELRGKHRWGHAFVGVVGAEPGTALETAQLIGVASVAVGSPLDGPFAYGGVSKVRFSTP